MSHFSDSSNPVEMNQYPRSCPGETTATVRYQNPETGGVYSQSQINSIQNSIGTLSSSTKQVTWAGDDDGDATQHEVYINGLHMTPFTSGNEEWDYGVWGQSESQGYSLDGESISTTLPSEGANLLPDKVRFACEDGNAAGGTNAWGYEKGYALVK